MLCIDLTFSLRLRPNHTNTSRTEKLALHISLQQRQLGTGNRPFGPEAYRYAELLELDRRIQA